MKTSFIANGTALACVAVLAVSCGGSGSKTPVAVEEETVRNLVRVETVRTETVAQTEEFTGTILPFTENNISPSLALRIQKINADIGSQVSQGQVLVELDKSSLLQSQVQLENLKTDLQRYQTLYQQGGISKQTLDQLETQV
ncbi:MAG: HlyD family secretion protein [Rikenellaceae bacterium]|nr:HlyD family secretion protein [Rikenellaceae bacterium]